MPDNANSRPGSPNGNGVVNDGSSLTLRALVTTKEAGIIIGKGGKNVADLRERTGVKAGVSKVVPGVHERVLSISGSIEGIAKAYSLIISQLLEPDSSTVSPGQTIVPPSHTSLRLLISHNLMGTIIGRQGLKIKAIQDASGARMIASKDMLPQSTERVVEVQGTAEGIGRAVEEIGRCLLEDWERGLGTVLYHPGAEGSGARTSDTKRTISSSASTTAASNGTGGNRRNAPGHSSRGANGNSAGAGAAQLSSPPSSPPPATPPNAARNSSSGLPNSTSATSKPGPPNPEIRTQNISIPSDMVGCIIGRGGTKITEIRRLSGSKISIAKTPHDDTGERMFTIVGTSEANEKALFLLYNQLESEKERRVGKDLAGDDTEATAA